MSDVNTNEAINIGILDMCDAGAAVLTFFFESSGKDLFKAVKLESASAFIIDFDAPMAEKVWEQTYNWTNKPGIIISTEEVQLESTVWLPKPLTAEALTQAGLKLKEILDIDSASKQEPNEEEALQRLLNEVLEESDSAIHTSSNGDNLHAKNASTARWALTCGDIENTPNSINLRKNSYNPNDYLFATFIKTLEQARESKELIMLKFSGITIIIDTFIDTIACNISIMDEEYAHACFDPSLANSIKIHALDESETRMHRKQVKNSPQNRYPIRSFIWTTSLLTSRGRLPEGTDIHQVIKLKEVPRMGNLESFPSIMDIVKNFKESDDSLFDALNKSEFPQPFIIAFYNGALALNMLENAPSLFSKEEVLEKVEKKRSFSNLFKRKAKQ